MTLIEAINRVDALKPNAYTPYEKIDWLSTLDGMVKRFVIDTHDGGEKIVFKGYDDETPIDTELLVKAPYEDIYIAWLESKIDYHNGEYVKYNNSITRYNDIYQGYCNDYNRTHMPKGSQIKYF